MRVLVLAKYLDLPEKHWIERVANTAGVDLHLAHDPRCSRAPGLTERGIAATRIRFRGRLDFNGIRRLRELDRRERFDIVHALRHHPLSNAFLAIPRPDCRFVAYRGVVGGIHAWDPACRLTFLHPRLSRIVCVSDAVRHYLLSRRVHPTKLVTIRKGHDPDWYRPAPRTALEALGVPPDAFVLSFVGTVRRCKGVGILLRAVESLPRSVPIHALLIGEVRDKEIREQANAPGLQGRVHLAGHRRDASALAGASDVFVLPTLWSEGLSKAAIEAMAQAVPVVLSDVAGNSELVEHDGSGLLVPPADPTALALAVEYLRTNPAERRRLGKAGRERIKHRFSDTITADLTLSLYQKLVPHERFPYIPVPGATKRAPASIPSTSTQQPVST